MKTIIKVFYILNFIFMLFARANAQLSHNLSGTIGLTKFQNYNFNDFNAPYSVINPIKTRVLDGFEIGAEYLYQNSKIGIGLALNYSYQEQRYLTTYNWYNNSIVYKANGTYCTNIIHIAPIINLNMFETKKGSTFYLKLMPQYSYLIDFNYSYYTFRSSPYDYTGYTKINNKENYYVDSYSPTTQTNTMVSSKNFIKNLFSLQMAIGHKFYLSKNTFINLELMARYTLNNTFKQNDTKYIWSLYMPINAIITDPNNIAETSAHKSTNAVRKPTHYRWAGLNIGIGYIWEKEGKVKVYKLW